MRGDGFTLLELLLAMTLLALIAAVAAPNLPRALEAGGLRRSTDAMVGELRRTRALALQQNAPARFPARPFDLAAGISVNFEPADGIRFFPDGSSSGGQVALSNGRDRRLIDVDWLTGRVSTARP